MNHEGTRETSLGTLVPLGLLLWIPALYLQSCRFLYLIKKIIRSQNTLEELHRQRIQGKTIVEYLACGNFPTQCLLVSAPADGDIVI